MFRGRSNALSFLGLPSNASDDNAKKAYRKLALRMHPNKPGGNNANFKRLGAAMNMIRNGGGSGAQWVPENRRKGPICEFIMKSKRKAAGMKEYSSFETINKNIEIGALFKDGKLTDAFVQHPDFEISLRGPKTNKYWSVDPSATNTDKIASTERMLREIQEECGYPVWGVGESKVGNRNYGSEMNNMTNMRERLDFSKILLMVERLYSRWYNNNRKARENFYKHF